MVAILAALLIGIVVMVAVVVGRRRGRPAAGVGP
jgi:hypothetical protein